MLILTRKFDETVWIGENICIRVLEIRGKQVKLEIEGPGAAKGEANRILSKRLDDTIYLGNSIYIKIAEIKGKQMKLGIEAPAKFLVLRGEEKFPEPDKALRR